MKVVGDFLYCTCVMHTKDEKEKERADMLNPLGDLVEEFFASSDEPGEKKLRIHDTCAIRISEVQGIGNAGMGYSYISTFTTQNTIKGTVEEFLEVIAKT